MHLFSTNISHIGCLREIERLYNSCPTPINLRPFGSDQEINPYRLESKRSISNYCCSSRSKQHQRYFTITNYISKMTYFFRCFHFKHGFVTSLIKLLLLQLGLGIRVSVDIRPEKAGYPNPKIIEMSIQNPPRYIFRYSNIRLGYPYPTYRVSKCPTLYMR